MAAYRVKFTPFLQSRKMNTFGLTGKGDLAIADGRFVFTAGKKEQAFEAAAIANVQRLDKMIRVEIPVDGKSPGFLTFWAKDAVDAEAIEAALPRTLTEEFARGLSEQLDFDARLRATTPRVFVTPALLAINFVVFALMLAGGAGLVQVDGRLHAQWGSNYGPYTTDGQYWRLFTSMFMHFGIVHLLVNMWALYEEGRVAERLYGNFTFLGLYVLSGLAGSLTSVYWNPSVNSAGASGAIFGVLGALFAVSVNKRNEVPLSVMKRLRTSSLVFIGYSLLYGFSVAGIDNAAHLGGLVAGFVLGLALARPLDAARRTSAARVAVPLAIVAAVLAVALFPLRGHGERGRADEVLRQAVLEFSKREEAALAAVKRFVTDATQGKMAKPFPAAQLERDIVTPFRECATKIGAVTLDSRSEMLALRDFLAPFCRLRAEGYGELISGIERDDAGAVTRARQKIDESDRLVADFNKKKTAK